MYSEPHDYPCPKRGVGLTHTWDHPWARCRECQMPLIVPAGPPPSGDEQEAPKPTGWLLLRFRSLGLDQRPGMLPDDDPVLVDEPGDMPATRDIDNLIEGKHTDDLGPKGHKDGAGRADLYGQHRARMEKLHAGYVRGFYD